MRTTPIPCLVFASAVTLWSAQSWTLANHFRSIPVDENAEHMHYRIVDGAGTSILIIRAQSEYGSVEFRARDIAERLNKALDNRLTHEDLYFEAEWHHGQPVIHQVSRDGTINFMIVAVTRGDVMGAKRRGGLGEAVELAREWLDRIDDATGAAQRLESQERAEERSPPGRGSKADAPLESDSKVAEGSGVGSRIEDATESAQHLESQEGEEEPHPPGRRSKAEAPLQGDSRGAEASELGPHGDSPRVRSGILLTLEPVDSAVYLDDTLVSFERPGPIPASRGEHVIAVVRPGYRPYFEKIKVQEGKIFSLDVRLETEDAEQD